MKLSRSSNVFGIALMALLIVMSASFDAMGQGRGRRVSRSDKKCEKFVNCHDARDGRWDGRGPNRDIGFRDRFYRRNRRNRDGDFDSINRRRRDRDRDSDTINQRRGNRDRDSDTINQRRRNRDRDSDTINQRRGNRDRDFDRDRVWRRR
jgi:hypothetical protein